MCDTIISISRVDTLTLLKDFHLLPPELVDILLPWIQPLHQGLGTCEAERGQHEHHEKKQVKGFAHNHIILITKVHLLPSERVDILLSWIQPLHQGLGTREAERGQHEHHKKEQVKRFAPYHINIITKVHLLPPELVDIL